MCTSWAFHNWPIEMHDQAVVSLNHCPPRRSQGTCALDSGGDTRSSLLHVFLRNWPPCHHPFHPLWVGLHWFPRWLLQQLHPCSPHHAQHFCSSHLLRSGLPSAAAVATVTGSSQSVDGCRGVQQGEGGVEGWLCSLRQRRFVQEELVHKRLPHVALSFGEGEGEVLMHACMHRCTYECKNTLTHTHTHTHTLSLNWVFSQANQNI